MHESGESFVSKKIKKTVLGISLSALTVLTAVSATYAQTVGPVVAPATRVRLLSDWLSNLEIQNRQTAQTLGRDPQIWWTLINETTSSGDVQLLMRLHRFGVNFTGDQAQDRSTLGTYLTAHPEVLDNDPTNDPPVVVNPSANPGNANSPQQAGAAAAVPGAVPGAVPAPAVSSPAAISNVAAPESPQPQPNPAPQAPVVQPINPASIQNPMDGVGAQSAGPVSGGAVMQVSGNSTAQGAQGTQVALTADPAPESPALQNPIFNRGQNFSPNRLAAARSALPDAFVLRGGLGVVNGGFGSTLNINTPTGERGHLESEAVLGIYPLALSVNGRTEQLAVRLLRRRLPGVGQFEVVMTPVAGQVHVDVNQSSARGHLLITPQLAAALGIESGRFTGALRARFSLAGGLTGETNRETGGLIGLHQGVDLTVGYQITDSDAIQGYLSATLALNAPLGADVLTGSGISAGADYIRILPGGVRIFAGARGQYIHDDVNRSPALSRPGVGELMFQAGVALERVDNNSSQNLRRRSAPAQ